MITENAINDYSTLTRVESPLISPQNPIHVLPAGSCIERGRAPLFPHPALVLKVRARAEDSGALWVERRGRGGVEEGWSRSSTLFLVRVEKSDGQ